MRTRFFYLAQKCHFPDIFRKNVKFYNYGMSNRDKEDILNVLRRQGFSKEFCDEIMKNADAGAMDYA